MECRPVEPGDVSELLRRARSGSPQAVGPLLEVYQNYLTILAGTQLNSRLRRRVSPSDLVQETMLAAHRDIGQFRGDSEREFLGWLRQILIHSLHHAIETHVTAQKRDVRCEVSMDDVAASVDRSALRLGSALAAPGPSPSSAMRQRERSVALADQLARLRPDYREVIVLRNLQGLSFEEVAQRMDRGKGAVRMLWLRAMEKLKTICDPID